MIARKCVCIYTQINMRVVVQTAGARHAAACSNRYLWWRQQGRAGARRLPLRFGRARAPARDRGNTSRAPVSDLFATVMGYFRFSQLIRPVGDCVDELFGLLYHVLSSAGSFWHSGNQKSVLRGFTRYQRRFKRYDGGDFWMNTRESCWGWSSRSANASLFYIIYLCFQTAPDLKRSS